MKEQLALLADEFGLAEIYAFGSRSREAALQLRNKEVRSAYSHSDMDIGVRLRSGVSLGPSARVQLAMKLEDLMDVSRVDLAILQEADPFLALEIIRGRSYTHRTWTPRPAMSSISFAGPVIWRHSRRSVCV